LTAVDARHSPRPGTAPTVRVSMLASRVLLALGGEASAGVGRRATFVRTLGFQTGMNVHGPSSAKSWRAPVPSGFAIHTACAPERKPSKATSVPSADQRPGPSRAE
jgi:hypothetical protein